MRVAFKTVALLACLTSAVHAAPAGNGTIIACGQNLTLQTDGGSFKEVFGAKTAQRLAALSAKLAPLLTRALDDLCGKKITSPNEIAKRATTIVIQNAAGADNFTAYFQKGTQAQMVVQWSWSDASKVEMPSAADVADGLRCAFKYTERACADRQP